MARGLKFAVLGLGLATALAGAVVPLGAAQAQPAQMIFGVDQAGDPAALEQVQFLYGGRNYCWYDGGWHGPGWYWCGYAWRRGWGWGGGWGWRGWHGDRDGRWHDRHFGGHGGGDHHDGGHGGGGHEGGHHH